jgi:hypothetical protein
MKYLYNGMARNARGHEKVCPIFCIELRTDIYVLQQLTEVAVTSRVHSSNNDRSENSKMRSVSGVTRQGTQKLKFVPQRKKEPSLYLKTSLLTIYDE